MTTPTLQERIYAAIPGYAAAATILANASKVTPTASTALADTMNELRSQVRTCVLEGRAIPDDLGDAAAEAERRERSAQLAALAFEEVIDYSRRERDFLESSPGDEPFLLLDEELAKVVVDTRALLPALEGATTAHEAIATGKAASDAWRDLQALADRYDEIRTVQAEFIPTGTLNYWPMLTSTGLYRNALTVSEYFIKRKKPTQPTGLQLSSEYSWWPSDVEKPTALLRIIEHATPWVPTPMRMGRAFEVALKIMRNRNIDTRHPRGEEVIQEMLTEYERITSS